MVCMPRPGWGLGFLLALQAPMLAQAPPAPPPVPKVELKENFPNPFFPSTTIPFDLFPEACSGNHQPTVSLKVYNVLVQVIAVPTLTGDAPARVDNLKLRCGEYRAFWDGKLLDGRRDVTPGVYYYQLVVDGQRYTRKMIVQRKVTSEK